MSQWIKTNYNMIEDRNQGTGAQPAQTGLLYFKDYSLLYPNFQQKLSR